MLAACSSTSNTPSNDSVKIGALLPFTGNQAAIGWNIEQAILLAQEDVNNAGGIAGKPLNIIERDSNSGTNRGLDQLLQLLYIDQVKYLIGPEEDSLANNIVQDIEGLDVLNILPGFGAPAIKRASRSGAWLGLAPTPYAMGCGVAKHAVQEGVMAANTLSSTDDYSMSLASNFGGLYASAGGKALPAVTVAPNAGSYESEINRVFSYDAQRTLLIVPTSTAADIVTEWTISGSKGAWYLSPLLRDEALLYNIPFGSLNGSFGMSPTLSLNSECEARSGIVAGYVGCKRDNARHFSRYFADNWDGAAPFPAANFYYDAVVLLALGLNYASTVQQEPVSVPRLQQIIRANNVPASAAATWWDLPTAMEQSRQGIPLRYVGAAAEYAFDQFGAAQFFVFDTWTVRNNAFVDAQPYYANCTH
jgi:ABC-type branched-subunit amino acid transport system substrate-binding protein